MNAARVLARPGPLVFMHIPKTAGTSVLDIVRLNCPAERLALHYPPDRVVRPEGPLEVVAGHVAFGYHRELGLDSAKYFTFVRDPLKRVISQVYFDRRVDPDLLPDLEARGVRHAILATRSWYYDNVLVRLFAGAGAAFGGLGPDDLARARANIERHFFFIGEQEHFRSDLRTLARLLGWRLPRLAPRTMRGAYQGYRLSRDDVAFLRQITRLDAQLWSEIRARHLLRPRWMAIERLRDVLEAAEVAARGRWGHTRAWGMARALLRGGAAPRPPRAPP
jgi:hypothetical protein